VHFSLEASVRIKANERRGLQRLLCDCARPPCAAHRREELHAHRLIYPLPKPGPDGRTELILLPLELIGRIAALLPPLREHRHRYYGVLAPNAPLPPAYRPGTPSLNTRCAPGARAGWRRCGPCDPRLPSPLYLWAMLLGRIYEAFPWSCPVCAAQMPIIAFITESVDVRAILEHIGEPATAATGRIRQGATPVVGGRRGCLNLDRGGDDSGRSPRPAGTAVRALSTGERVAARRGLPVLPLPVARKPSGFLALFSPNPAFNPSQQPRSGLSRLLMPVGRGTFRALTAPSDAGGTLM